MLDLVHETKFHWLIPIFSNEYNFISSNGYSDFETFLEFNDPNMAIFDRSPLEI